MNQNISVVLNASRWIAALTVVVTHVHHLLLANFPDVKAKSLLLKACYFFSSFGAEAVVIFFVISGFLVGGLSADRWHRNMSSGLEPDFAEYFVQRFARIYTVLIPALLAGLVLDYLGGHYFDSSGLYADPSRFHTILLADPVANSLDVTAFFGNLLMLETFRVPVFGSNGPLWSLAFEWWYYCLFAAAAAMIVRPGASRVVCLLILVGACVLLPLKLLIWSSIWMLGLLVHFYLRSGFPKPRPLVGMSVFVAALVLCRVSHSSSPEVSLIGPFARDFGLGLAYAFFIASLTRLSRPLRGAALHDRLASFSYSLYLVHFPAMLITAAAASQFFGLELMAQPSVKVYGCAFVIVLMLCAYAFCFSWLTERHTRTVAGTLRKFVTMVRTRPVASP